MNYSSLTGTDFKNVTPLRKGSRHRFLYALYATLATTAIVGAIIAGMVFAHSNQSAPTKTLLTNIPLTIKPISNHRGNRDKDNSENPFIAVKQHTATNKPATTLSKVGNHRTVVIKKGDTLSSIFTGLDVHFELPRILNLGKLAKPFKRIYPGQKLHFTFGENGINKLELEKNPIKSVLLYRSNNSFTVKEIDRELDRVPQFTTAIIDNSLFLAGQNIGMSDRLIMDLAGIFGWDIDFALDIRKGDSFTVIYEELYSNGEKIRDGNIIAAEFINHGKIYRAYRYINSNGKTEYYAPNGKSMRKPFMRTPVSIARISSHFNLRRRHPILNKIRAHRGVDYAAPTGTPIKATGAGKVIYRGTKGGYGKTIIVRHGNIYTTLYAHMSKYARGTRVGNRIKQGQTIGYIGSTGLSTGPHLHYEFRINGVHRNPLKVKMPDAKPLPDAEMAVFQASIRPSIAQLDAYKQNVLVMRDL